MRHFAAHVGVSLFFPFSPKNIYLKADTTVAECQSKHKCKKNQKKRKKRKRTPNSLGFGFCYSLSFGMQEVKSKGDIKKKDMMEELSFPSSSGAAATVTPSGPSTTTSEEQQQQQQQHFASPHQQQQNQQQENNFFGAMPHQYFQQPYPQHFNHQMHHYPSRFGMHHQHPFGMHSSSPRGQFSPRARVGDWMCPNGCGLVFSSKTNCFRCGVLKPPGSVRYFFFLLSLSYLRVEREIDTNKRQREREREKARKFTPFLSYPLRFLLFVFQQRERSDTIVFFSLFFFSFFSPRL